jgi:hypothetical protein
MANRSLSRRGRWLACRQSGSGQSAVYPAFLRGVFLWPTLKRSITGVVSILG